jgi:hypothetical protein
LSLDGKQKRALSMPGVDLSTITVDQQQRRDVDDNDQPDRHQCELAE